MIKLHNDLLITIKNYEEQLEFAEDTKKSLEKLLNVRKPNDIKAMSYNSEIRGCRNDTTLDRLSPIYLYTIKRIECYTEVLEGLRTQVDNIQADFKKLEGLHSKVYKMHVIDNMTLQEIADELGYSHQYILDTNCEIGKMLKNDR